MSGGASEGLEVQKVVIEALRGSEVEQADLARLSGVDFLIDRGRDVVGEPETVLTRRELVEAAGFDQHLELFRRYAGSSLAEIRHVLVVRSGAVADDGGGGGVGQAVDRLEAQSDGARAVGVRLVLGRVDARVQDADVEAVTLGDGLINLLVVASATVDDRFHVRCRVVCLVPGGPVGYEGRS